MLHKISDTADLSAISGQARPELPPTGLRNVFAVRVPDVLLAPDDGARAAHVLLAVRVHRVPNLRLHGAAVGHEHAITRGARAFVDAAIDLHDWVRAIHGA